MRLPAMITVLTVFTCAVTLQAQVPGTIGYQGYLTDTGGSHLDGLYDITFRIYDRSYGGTALWTELHTGVDVDLGAFSVILGEINPLSESYFIGPPRWLGVKIDTDPEIDPRTQIASVPWAFRAAVAETALAVSGGVVGDGHSLDAVDGSPVDAVYVNVGGKVGIGTTGPTARLDVADGANDAKALRLRAGNSYSSSTREQILLSYDGTASYTHAIKSRHNASNASGNAIDFYLWDQATDDPGSIGSKRVMTIDGDGNGRVGIGTTSPYAKLHVDNYEVGLPAVYGYNPADSTLGALGTYLAGVYGWSDDTWPVTYAGYFAGDARVTGDLSVDGQSIANGLFHAGADMYAWQDLHAYGDIYLWGEIIPVGSQHTIDHPVDSDNMALGHNDVQSPENLLIYRGVAALDHAGEGVVQLPGYFEELAAEEGASVTLTPVGRPFQVGYEWESGSIFKAYGEPGREVSWVVYAERDVHAARSARKLIEGTREDSGRPHRHEELPSPSFNGGR